MTLVQNATTDSPDSRSLYVIFECRPPSPNVLCYSGLVDVITRKEADLKSPPELGDRRWPVGVRTKP